MGELLRSWLGGCLREWDLRHLGSESGLRLTESLLFPVLVEEVLARTQVNDLSVIKLNQGFFR